MAKRIFIGGIGTETNTFVPFPTGEDAFTRHVIPKSGEAEKAPNMFTAPLHVWRHSAETMGWDVVVGLSAYAGPSGMTVRTAWESLRDQLLAELKAALPLDAVMLSLHGAMVADGYEDCEGDLITRVRSLCGPTVIIAVELDPHNHMTDAKCQADIIVTYKENPHIDTGERAKEVFAITRDALAGKVKPVIGRFDCHMIGRYATPVDPIRSFVAKMKSHEGRDGILSVSLVHGFPMADVAVVGTHILVVADGDVAKANALAKELGESLYAMRESTRIPRISPEELVRYVTDAPPGKPIIAAESTDNPGSGFAGDATLLLRHLVEADITQHGRLLIALVWDPLAYMIAEPLPVGARTQLRVGGKAGILSGIPLDLDVTVMGRIRDASMSFGPNRNEVGNVLWVRTDSNIDIVINTKRTQITHPDVLEAVGVQPQDYRLIVVKSTQHFYAGFSPLASKVLYVDASLDGRSSDFSRMPYTRRNPNFWPRVADPLGLDGSAPDNGN